MPRKADFYRPGRGAQKKSLKFDVFFAQRSPKNAGGAHSESAQILRTAAERSVNEGYILDASDSTVKAVRTGLLAALHGDGIVFPQSVQG